MAVRMRSEKPSQLEAQVLQMEIKQLYLLREKYILGGKDTLKKIQYSKKRKRVCRQ
jgi:hypothetical protein